MSYRLTLSEVILLAEKIILTNSSDDTALIFGSYDFNATLIERAFDVKIKNQARGESGGDSICITGETEAVNKAANVLEYLKRISGSADIISEQSVQYVIDLIKDGVDDPNSLITNDVICLTSRGKPIKAKTVGQKRYISAIKKNTVVFVSI